MEALAVNATLDETTVCAFFVIVAGTAHTPWQLPACLLGGKANDNKNVICCLGPWSLVRSRTFLTWVYGLSSVPPRLFGPPSLLLPGSRRQTEAALVSVSQPWKPRCDSIVGETHLRVGGLSSQRHRYLHRMTSQEIKGTSSPVGGQAGGCTSVLSISPRAIGV